MSYGILLSLEARNQLARLPIPVRRHAFKQLEVLAEYAVLLSQPSHFPFRENCQIFHFDCNSEGLNWELSALFKYSQDEQSIYVLTVGFCSYGPEDADNRSIPPKEPPEK